jgi:DNA-directed RNA polymerase alpha subunit
MERVVELYEDVPKHLLALKHFAVKFEAFAAIDVQRLE